MTPRRVGVVVNAWPGQGSPPSGTGRHAQLLSGELARRGVEVHVLVVETGPADVVTDAVVDGVAVRRATRVRASHRSAHRNVALARDLARWLAEVAPDLVHVVHPGEVGTAGPALVAAAGLPVVATVCDGLYGCAMGHLVNPLITRPLCTLPVDIDTCSACMAAGTGVDASRFLPTQRERRAGAAASATAGPFVADSAFMGAAVARTVPGDHRVVLWPVVLDPAPPAPRLEGPLRLGYFGVPLWRKGIDVLLDAVAGLDDVELHVHGPRDAAAEQAYAAAARDRADRLPNVVWHPPYEPGEVAALMAGVDLVAVPSRAESLPGVAKEALAAGRPVLAAAIAGLPEIVVDGVTGWLVDAADPAVWRASIEALDVTAVRALHPDGRRSAAAYVDDLLAVYADALAAWPERAAAAPWAAGLAAAAELRRTDPYLRADERFQAAVLALSDGRRAAALTGLVRSVRRDAFDRLLVMPAWFVGVARGHRWAAERARDTGRAAATASGRRRVLGAVTRALVGRA